MAGEDVVGLIFFFFFFEMGERLSVELTYETSPNPAPKPQFHSLARCATPHTHVHDVCLVPVVAVSRRADDEQCVNVVRGIGGVSVCVGVREPEKGREGRC